VFQLDKPSACPWRHSLPLSIPDGTGLLVYTYFPNRVIYRAHRRFIGPLGGYDDVRIKKLLYINCQGLFFKLNLA